MYDFIITGASLPSLMYSTRLNCSKILILEKSNYLGGSWRNTSENFCNVDLGCHLIVPSSDQTGEQIIKEMKKYNIPLEKINKNNFFSEDKSWMSYGKEGTPLICSKGWVYFLNRVINLIKLKKNITVIKNFKIDKIIAYDTNCKVFSSEKEFQTKKLILPTYFFVEKILHKEKLLKFDCEKIINSHMILKIKTIKKIIPKFFNGFYEKEPKNLFDRISADWKEKDDIIILSCRISKEFKNSDSIYDKKLIKNLLIRRNIISDNDIILENKIYNYECYYRNPTQRNLMEIELKKINSIKYIKTHYMGHFLEYLFQYV